MPTPEDVIINMINNLYEHSKNALRIIYPAPDYDSVYNEKMELLNDDLKERIAAIRAATPVNDGSDIGIKERAADFQRPDFGLHELPLEPLESPEEMPFDLINQPQVKIGGTKRHTRRFKKYKHIR